MALADSDRLRIDKWLWFARLARTRTAAKKLAVSGRVRVNREKNDSASRSVHVGDVLTVALDSGVRVLRIVALGDRRGPARAAQSLYEDLAPPEPTSPRAQTQRPGPRPTKRERRALNALRLADPVEDDYFPPRD